MMQQDPMRGLTLRVAIITLTPLFGSSVKWGKNCTSRSRSLDGRTLRVRLLRSPKVVCYQLLYQLILLKAVGCRQGAGVS